MFVLSQEHPRTLSYFLTTVCYLDHYLTKLHFKTLLRSVTFWNQLVDTSWKNTFLRRRPAAAAKATRTAVAAASAAAEWGWGASRGSSPWRLWPKLAAAAAEGASRKSDQTATGTLRHRHLPHRRCIHSLQRRDLQTNEWALKTVLFCFQMIKDALTKTILVPRREGRP